MKKEEISRIKTEANMSKQRLIYIMNKLNSVGATKDAEQLEKIIIRLEVWQNR